MLTTLSKLDVHTKHRNVCSAIYLWYDINIRFSRSILKLVYNCSIWKATLCYRQREHLWWIVSQCSLSDDAIVVFEVRLIEGQENLNISFQCLSAMRVSNRQRKRDGILGDTAMSFHAVQLPPFWEGKGLFLGSQNSKSQVLPKFQFLKGAGVFSSSQITEKESSSA